ncbi:tyrosine/phenylalanine carboxypeptidase domain-containing protein [Sorangium sp. So ce1151]|uniref:tyrosine/phenylalanine carboxypeptidase domain-containing protein n=1 Tax=Sorangium sp. So ce1151 TaxID=3133332 RepID=UPI003F616F3F
MARRPRARSAEQAAPPAWVPDADRLLGAAARRIRVVGASTPVNLVEELARLAAAWGLGGAELPRFAYAPAQDHSELRRAMETAAERLAGQGELGAVYAGRARELAAEAAICEAAGGAGCWAAARHRYAARDAFDEEADALAATWVEEAAGAAASEEARVRSDDARSPGSLVSRMRSEIGARRLPLRVVIADIAPLAATGDGVIQVARGRMLTRDDVERTVLHEIEGHAAPGVRAAGLPLGIFLIGTAHGGDDQEGWALARERAAGYLVGARRTELGLRHLAARSVERGAGFVETARLLEARGVSSTGDALRIAARVHRGGGLAREVVYLPALLRVEALLLEQPALGQVLASGRVSVSAAASLSSWAGVS